MACNLELLYSDALGSVFGLGFSLTGTTVMGAQDGSVRTQEIPHTIPTGLDSVSCGPEKEMWTLQITCNNQPCVAVSRQFAGMAFQRENTCP